ncbi:hypothetical protein [Syntrophorhabdus aromaticivorans]|uniref:hypothetical protein n=1 Tax=Syntrophorhabdus aromaticivorans TaxID=328301 RepID=UPI0018DDBE61|nr:hypothetical protein [Syntrophorhabdus aromaticivorans]
MNAIARSIAMANTSTHAFIRFDPCFSHPLLSALKASFASAFASAFASRPAFPARLAFLARLALPAFPARLAFLADNMQAHTKNSAIRFSCTLSQEIT